MNPLFNMVSNWVYNLNGSNLIRVLSHLLSTLTNFMAPKSKKLLFINHIVSLLRWISNHADTLWTRRLK